MVRIFGTNWAFSSSIALSIGSILVELFKKNKTVLISTNMRHATGCGMASGSTLAFLTTCRSWPGVVQLPCVERDTRGYDSIELCSPPTTIFLTVIGVDFRPSHRLSLIDSLLPSCVCGSRLNRFGDALKTLEKNSQQPTTTTTSFKSYSQQPSEIRTHTPPVHNTARWYRRSGKLLVGQNV